MSKDKVKYCHHSAALLSRGRRDEQELEELEFKGGDIYLVYILPFLVLGFTVYRMGMEMFTSYHEI